MPADIEKLLKKTGQTHYTFEELEVDLGENLFVPGSVLKKLRKEAFVRPNIKTEKDMDKRIKALVGALNTLSDKILEMRNSQGDAHAHGSNRIVIKEEEAILAANSSMVLCEYLFTKYKGLNR